MNLNYRPDLHITQENNDAHELYLQALKVKCATEFSSSQKNLH